MLDDVLDTMKILDIKNTVKPPLNKPTTKVNTLFNDPSAVESSIESETRRPQIPQINIKSGLKNDERAKPLNDDEINKSR